MKKNFNLFYVILLLVMVSAEAQLQNHNILNEPPDVSKDFQDYKNTYYLADELIDFNPKTGQGTIKYLRHRFVGAQAFDNMLGRLQAVEANEFPATEYEASPEMPFTLQFVSDRTIRIKTSSGPQYAQKEASLMLINGTAPNAMNSWEYTKVENGHQYSSKAGKVILSEKPWKIAIYDAKGKLLTSTLHMNDVKNTYTPVTPFGYVRKASDYSRSMNAVFSLSPNEKIYGCGESFTEFNKRGQKVVLYIDDANGVQNETMYKPIPFYMSSRGYGVFMHHSTPISVDFGKYFSGANSMMIGDDEADLFVFLGEPKDILDEYTDLTGKPEMPPLWSFGFWMSRITYFSEEEGRAIAQNLRKHKIPSDVIHFDTGWFDVDWRNDYQFSASRFNNPEGMIKDLKADGFNVCLWQLPYFTPKNTLFNEIVGNQLAVKDAKGNLPYEDAVLDFTNPATISWYQNKIESLLKMGVGVIKVDFGEAAPLNGIYHNGRTGFYEHNMFPLRYNKAVYDITKKTNGEGIIWARSTWAGSQRYPLHWGGDAATSNTAMAATLRGGLSLGLSGFTFWSHDIGGFVTKSPEDLYRRWTPFGMLTSHVRSHGEPPTEPWEYSKEFLEGFRKADNMRYQLLPYIYAEAKHASQNGLPMVRALFVEYPNDPGSWLVDDQYLFGSSVLVAPLFEETEERPVYLPPGEWVDYQTGKSYASGWHTIKAGEIPVVMLVKSGTALPHIKLAQSTKDLDWNNITLKLYGTCDIMTGKLFVPGGSEIKNLELNKDAGKYVLKNIPEGIRIKIQP
ncbi:MULTISPECIES: alpha-xylosidase [Flavobacteriaceae]|uniref:glycoside hydrolase family 31 protein n=1 Tax=Flavobacteriaceae TaxID=49546 RepID=UPI0014911EFA|nr:MULTISPECIES: alpha-xylosidase [Allomuricauda]MDC6367703.1 glycoside hydrolase family 31 protein [Muricauda sp. AC10]